MYNSRLRSQNKNKNTRKNKENIKQQLNIALSMDKTNSPVQERLREINQISLAEHTPTMRCGTDRGSLHANYTDSPFRFVQVMDKRFEKLSEQLKINVQKMFHEYEERLLSEIDKMLNMARSEIKNLTERVSVLETEVQAIKDTVSSKLIELSAEGSKLKKEVEILRKSIKDKENYAVANEMRINCVPQDTNENLHEIYRRMCDAIEINPPVIKEIYRVKSNNSNRNINENVAKDSPIIIKFANSYDRNSVLSSIKNYIKSKKDSLRLNLIGFHNSTPFYVNENLTRENYRIFASAYRLMKAKVISAAFIHRGLVYIKHLASDGPLRIDEHSALDRFFRPESDVS